MDDNITNFMNLLVGEHERKENSIGFVFENNT